MTHGEVGLPTGFERWPFSWIRFMFHGISACLFLGMVACCLAATSPAYAISIDGNFSDWSVSQLLGTDVPGDVSDGDPVDWVGLWAAFENNSLFLSYQTRWNIDFVGNSWRYAVFIDVDSRAETGYRGFPGGALVGAEYLIEGGTVYRYGGDGTNWIWNMVGNSVYAFYGPRLEMSIPGNILGMTGASRIRILLAGNNPTTVDYARQDRAGFSFPADLSPS